MGQGFYVKVGDQQYLGPFDSLSVARDEARTIGPELLIFHGLLEKVPEETVDDSLLFLVPKLKK
jgi:hypothetical protein